MALLKCFKKAIYIVLLNLEGTFLINNLYGCIWVIKLKVLKFSVVHVYRNHS